LLITLLLLSSLLGNLGGWSLLVCLCGWLCVRCLCRLWARLVIIWCICWLCRTTCGTCCRLLRGWCSLCICCWSIIRGCLCGSSCWCSSTRIWGSIWNNWVWRSLSRTWWRLISLSSLRTNVLWYDRRIRHYCYSSWLLGSG
jgi:hypothetical protein